MNIIPKKLLTSHQGINKRTKLELVGKEQKQIRSNTTRKKGKK